MIPLDTFLLLSAVLFATGLYGVLEKESFQNTIRIPTNNVLKANISHLLIHPVGQTPPQHSDERK